GKPVVSALEQLSRTTFVRAAKLHTRWMIRPKPIEKTMVADANIMLEPLKEATKRLEARGKAGRFGAIYEVIPVFEAVLAVAPEDHLPINLRAAWAKLNAYYTKLDESPAYFAATCLHPYYKNYCENSWRDKPSWLEANNLG
ncbi:hypothetical protein PtrV1_12146, partial [Pyrenophora tritici-repentis]